MVYSYWTPKKERILKKEYGKISPQKLSKTLNVSLDALKLKANRMNIHSDLSLFKKEIPSSAHQMSPELAYVLGAYLGDGYLDRKKRIVLNVRDKDFALNFKEKLEKWSSYPAVIDKYNSYKFRQGFFWRTALYSKEAVKIIEEYKEKLGKEPLNKENKIAFLEGLFDAEGCAYFDRNNYFRQVNFANKNISLLLYAQKLLQELGIESYISPKNEKGVYRLIITDKENLLKFSKVINPSIKEKRENIKRIISSYE